jgi:hypothetical protein
MRTTPSASPACRKAVRVNFRSSLLQLDLTRSSVILCLLLCGPARADEDAASYVQFSQEPTATCVSRNGQQILVRNSHPTRKLRVWLDRMHMGIGTGDRSRSDLAPGAEPEPLGCSRNLNGVQEWRVVRVVFID